MRFPWHDSHNFDHCSSLYFTLTCTGVAFRVVATNNSLSLVSMHVMYVQYIGSHAQDRPSALILV